MAFHEAEHACAARRRQFDGFPPPGAKKHYPPDLELDPIHLDIDITLDLELEACFGTVTHTVVARRTGPTEFRLHGIGLEGLSINDPDGHELDWQYDGQEIVIRWRQPVPQDERRRAAIHYRVEKPRAGLYFSRPTPAYPDTPWWAATDHETERARYWLPCVDLPNARPHLDFHIRAAERFTILANGELQSEVAHGDGTKTAHWRLDFPCPSYLTCFVVGDLVRADDGDFEGRPIAYFAPPSFTPEDLRRSFGRTRDMLAWMTEKLGQPFPFPKYFQVALPGFGGAMENISLVSWDDGFVMDEKLAQEWNRLVDEVNLHEMAHSYFGDAVVCRDYAHAWLKESWATYMEQVWFADRAGRDEQLYQYYRDAQAYFQEADERYQRPIVTREFASSWELYDAHLYPGGACRLHTLCQEIGEATFWTAVRDYLRRYAGQVVETDDFRRVLEEHSGRSLGRFFDQWFFGKGYPKIKVTFRYDSDRREGTFEIEQTQVDEKAGIPAFELKTDVGWLIDGQLHTAPVTLTERRHVITVPMPRDPDQVRFDPHHRILHKLEFNPGDGRLRTQLRSATDVLGRILAAGELAKTGNGANIAAIRDAYREEPFWGARVEFAAALGRAGSQAAIDALVDLVAWEHDPMVLRWLLRSAGSYRDERLAAAITDRLADDLPYGAQAAALETLGKQRAAGPLALLQAAAEREGWGGIVQSAAFRGLAQSRQPEALPFLEARIGYGALGNRARPAAVAALGTLAAHQERHLRATAMERLCDLLRDPVQRVRSSAVTALETLGEAGAIEALERYRAQLALQEQVRVDRAISKLRRGEEPRLSALEKQLEEARGEMRRLSERLEKLEGRTRDREAGSATETAAKRKNGGRRAGKKERG